MLCESIIGCGSFVYVCARNGLCLCICVYVYMCALVPYLKRQCSLSLLFFFPIPHLHTAL